MTRREIQRRRQRKRRQQVLRQYARVGLMTLVLVGVIAIVWKLVGPSVMEDRAEEVKADATEVQAPVDPDAAKKVAISADRIPASAIATTDEAGNDDEAPTLIAGWQTDDNGSWYLNEDSTYYQDGWITIDGQRYYFDQNGYRAAGWITIDGEYHFFDENGVEDTTAEPKLVALTYDDGPSAHTDRILDVLEANNAKATFFVVGTQIEAYPEQLKREDELGMEIGSHTYDHTYLDKVDGETIRSVMDKNDELIIGLIGHGTSIMRPTGGGINDTVSSNVGKPMICWDVDTLDWKTKDVSNTISTALENIQDGSIILMHDLYEQTAEASEALIPELIKQGYLLVTVSELAEARGVTLEDGKVYYDFKKKAETSVDDSTDGSIDDTTSDNDDDSTTSGDTASDDGSVDQ